MKYLLDTDHVSLLQWHRGADYAALVANLSRHAEADIGVSVVSYLEQALGCNKLVHQARTPADVVNGYDLLFRVIRDFRVFTVVPFDATAAAAFDDLKRHKLRVGTMDRRIAATALSRNLVVVTRNARDFGKVPGLALEDWTR